jgi:TP901 family phage tail tape measure protein
MPDFAVTTAFKATDRVSPVFRKMSGSAEAFGIRGSKAMQRVSRAQSALISKMKMYAGLGIGIAAGLITREFLNFDQAITAASAKFPGLTDNTEESRKILEKLRMTARMVGRDTQFSAAQAAQGLDFLAMAGFSAEQSMSLLPGVTNLATVANVDLARATDIASDAIGAFGLMTQDTAQLEKNFIRINDVMAATMTRANTNMEDLFESIKKGAASFTAAGQSLESFNALAGIMANSGLKGAESGTQLRNIMLRLAAPTAGASKLLNQLGIRTRDSEGNFRDIIDILADFEKGTKNMGTAQRSAALSTIFGARSVTGMNILLQEGTENITKFREGLLEAGGASEKMATVMRQSLLNRLKALLSAVIELGFKFIDAFSKQGGDAIDKLTNIARALGPVFEFLGKVMTKIIKILPYLIGGFVTYKLVLKGIYVTQKIMMAVGWVKYIIMMRKVIWTAIKATKAWAVVQKIMNVILTANPIGLIIVGIAALIAIIIVAIKYYDKFGAVILGLLGPVGWLVSGLVQIYRRWDRIKAAFKEGGIKAGIMEIGKAILDGILYPLQKVYEFLGKIPGRLGKSYRDSAKNIETFREKYLGAVKEAAAIVDKTNKAVPVPVTGGITSPSKPQAPNETEARARRIDFQGRIDIAGAPEGTQLQSQTRNAPPILLQLIGVE